MDVEDDKLEGIVGDEEDVTAEVDNIPTTCKPKKKKKKKKKPQGQTFTVVCSVWFFYCINCALCWSMDCIVFSGDYNSTEMTGQILQKPILSINLIGHPIFD